MTFRITSITAFTTVGDDDEEGVMAFLDPGGVWIPMVAADARRVDQLRELAQTLFPSMEWHERRFVPDPKESNAHP